jgi:hypothetical protein
MKHTNENFTNRALRLDGEEFHNCSFQNCTLEIGGAAEIVLDTCTFTTCRWVFVEAAATTLAIISRLYAGLAKDGDALIEQLFGYIRAGSGFGQPFELPTE